MDDSFGAAMAGLVIEDASRMSGARFADARGTGVARRVRTRRRVRAAGMGGASAVAVGAIAVGAAHMPWRGAANPVGAWPEGCTPTPVEDVGRIWDDAAVPAAHVIDVSEEFLDETWLLYDDTLGMVVLQMVPNTFGLDVTYADGTKRQVVQSETLSVVFEAPGGGWITFDPTDSEHHAMWHAEQPGEASSVRQMDAVTPPFEWQWSGCGLGVTRSASATSSSESPIPSPLPDPYVEPFPSADVVGDTPFECGFVFPEPTSVGAGLSVENASMVARDVAEGKVRADGMRADIALLGDPAEPVAQAVFSDLNEKYEGEVQGGSRYSPADPGNGEVHYLYPDEPAVGPFTGRNFGYGFVAVSDGVVTGSWSPSEDPADGSMGGVSPGPENTGPVYYLFAPEVAIASCDGSPLNFDQVDLYAVAGAAETVKDVGMVRLTYAWRPVEPLQGAS